MKHRFAKIAVGVASAVMVSLSGFADVVYNNSTTYSGSYVTSTTEFGDQIFTVGPTVNNRITDFQFEYYGSLAPNASGRTAVVKFYANDGAPVGGAATPGTTALYTSPSFSLAAGYNTVNIVALGANNVFIPSNGSITWTVSFSGLQAGEAVGLLIYERPSIGNSNIDYWQKDSGGAWALKQIAGGSPAANFGAKLTALPEPSILQLTGLAGAFLAGLAGYRRYSK